MKNKLFLIALAAVSVSLQTAAMLRNPRDVAQNVEASKFTGQTVQEIRAIGQVDRSAGELNPFPFSTVAGEVGTMVSSNYPLKQPDGKKVFEAKASIGGGKMRLLKTRYNADGTLDRTFGDNGIEYGPEIDGSYRLPSVTNPRP